MRVPGDTVVSSVVISGTQKMNQKFLDTGEQRRIQRSGARVKLA